MATDAFLSTLSLRRATAIGRRGTGGRDNFYPRSPCGERQLLLLMAGKSAVFLSTLSLRRATVHVAERPSPGGISIHALLAESDGACHGARQSMPHFYPRSPCGERLSVDKIPYQREIFLSTLSLRRATRHRAAPTRPGWAFLSTLSLRRATAKVHKTVGHFCAYETNFMGIASSC